MTKSDYRQNKGIETQRTQIKNCKVGGVDFEPENIGVQRTASLRVAKKTLSHDRQGRRLQRTFNAACRGRKGLGKRNRCFGGVPESENGRR